MKNLKIAILSILVCSLLAFTAQNTGGLKGQITPVAGIGQVLLITGRDTLVVPVQNGSFKLNQLKARTYQLIVKTIAPYQEFSLSEVAVIDSATTDIGQIKLLR